MESASLTFYWRSFVFCGQRSCLLWTTALRVESALGQGEEGNWYLCAYVFATCGEGGLSSSEQLLLSGLALTGAVYYASQRPAKSIYFSHSSAANTLTLLDQAACNGHSLLRTPSNPLFPARDYLSVHHVRRNY